MLYIFLAEGFEEVEALTVVDLLRRAKCDITSVSITGNKAVCGSHGITVMADQHACALAVHTDQLALRIVVRGDGLGQIMIGLQSVFDRFCIIVCSNIQR